MCWFGLIWFDWDFTVVYHSKPAKVTSEAATAFFWCEMQLRISCGHDRWSAVQVGCVYLLFIRRWWHIMRWWTSRWCFLTFHHCQWCFWQGHWTHCIRIHFKRYEFLFFYHSILSTLFVPTSVVAFPFVSIVYFVVVALVSTVIKFNPTKHFNPSLFKWMHS